MAWYVYLLQSAQISRTYVGIALDVSERLAQHNGVRAGGAKATRVGRPWQLIGTRGPFRSRARAQQVEYALKQARGAARTEALRQPLAKLVLARSRR